MMMNREFSADGRTYVYEDDGTYRVEGDGSRTRIANFAMAIKNDDWLADKSDIGIQLTIDGNTGTLYAPYEPEELVEDSSFPLFPWLVEKVPLDLEIYGPVDELRRVVLAEYRERVPA